MRRWVYSLLLVGFTIGIVLWALAPTLITYSNTLPPEITFTLGDRSSIEQAILLAQSEATETFRTVLGKSVWVLAILAFLNSVIAGICIMRNK